MSQVNIETVETFECPDCGCDLTFEDELCDCSEDDEDEENENDA